MPYPGQGRSFRMGVPGVGWNGRSGRLYVLPVLGLLLKYLIHSSLGLCGVHICKCERMPVAVMKGIHVQQGRPSHRATF